jgi:hypothetical protein
MVAKIGYKELLDLIMGTKGKLFLAMPGLPSELMKGIVEMKDKIEDIRVILDVSEEGIRNGYGDIESFEGLTMTLRSSRRISSVYEKNTLLRSRRVINRSSASKITKVR